VRIWRLQNIGATNFEAISLVLDQCKFPESEKMLLPSQAPRMPLFKKEQLLERL
jgi:hypothetical protein